MTQRDSLQPIRARRIGRLAVTAGVLVLALGGCASSQSERWAQNAPTIAPEPRDAPSTAAVPEVVHLGARGAKPAGATWTGTETR